MNESLYVKMTNKWLHTGFQRYFKNTLWTLAGRVFSLVVSFFTTVYVIRYLGPSNYGLLAFSVSFVGIFSFISGLGMDQILFRELSKNIVNKDNLLGTSFMLKLIASLLTMFLIIACLAITNNDSVTNFLVIINSFTLLFGSFGVISFYFQSRVEAKYNSISLIAVTLILSALKIGVVFLNKGVIYLSLILVLEAILYSVIGIFIYTTRGNNLFRWRFDRKLAIKLLADSWPLMLSTAFVLIYTRIDQVMIKFMTNNFNVGVYDSAVRISEVWYFIPALITSSLFPAIINANKVSKELFDARMIKLYSVLIYSSLFVAVIVTFMSKFIIDFIYGAEFAGAQSVLNIYIWAAIPSFITIAMNSYLIAENKTKVMFFISLVGMIANVLLNILLIPTYGIQGAAIATLVSYSMIPISVFFIKNTGNQYSLIKSSILLPFRYIKNNE